METKPIHFAFQHSAGNGPGDYRAAALAFAQTRAALDAALAPFAKSPSEDARALASMLDMIERIDNLHGADGPLPIEGLDAALTEAMGAAAHTEAALDRLAVANATNGLDQAVLALGLWAARHHVDVSAPEIWINALARAANGAQTRQDCAAIYALMQGAIAHLAPQLEADLERSNPERPWRILNLNFAITAIRSGDAALMRFAFDTLNRHLPLDAPGFFEDAAERARTSDLPAEHRELIETEWARWTRTH
jgi:hypothetical protein